MALTIHEQIWVDVESAFNVRNGSPSWSNVQASEISYSPRREALADPTQQGQQGVNDPIIGSQAGGALSFKTSFVGLQTAAGDNTAATAIVHGKLWRAAVGTEDLVVGTVITGGTVTVPIVTRRSGGPAAGNVVGFATNDGHIHPRMVISVADSSGDDALTLDRGLPSLPDNGNVVYGAANYTFSGLGPSTTLQAQARTETTDSDFELYGLGNQSWSVESIAPGKNPMNMFEWLMGSYEDDAGTIGALTPSAATLLKKSIWTDSRVAVWTYASSPVAYASAQDLCMRSFSAKGTHALNKAPCPNSVEGISGWEYGQGSICDADWTVNRTDDWRDIFVAGASAAATHLGQCISFGSIAGQICGIYLPYTVITADPEFGDDNGQATTQVKTSVGSSYPSDRPPLVIFQM